MSSTQLPGDPLAVGPFPRGMEPSDSDRRQRGREFLTLKQKYGISPEAIAEREKLSRAFVYRLLKEATEEATAGRAEAPPPAAAERQPVPRKISEGTLLRRAHAAMRTSRVFRLIDAEAKLFWIDLLLEIREQGDGGDLYFHRPGDLYGSQAKFLEAFGRTSADLQKLFDPGLLLRLEFGGMGMPFRFGLRRDPGVPIERRAGKHPDPRQPEMLQVLQGGRSEAARESTKNPFPVDSESTRHPPSVDSESTKTGGAVDSESTNNPISVDSCDVVRAAAAAAYAKESSTLGSSSSPGTRERESTAESTEIGNSVDSESTAGAVSVDSALAGLAAELMALAGLDRKPRADELGFLEGWLALDTPEQIRTGIAGKMAERQGKRGKPPSSLNYFDGPLKEKREGRKLAQAAAARPSGAAAPAPASAPPLSEAEQALKARLLPFEAANRRDRAGSPWPPSLADFRAESPLADLASRWLDQGEGWITEGRPRDLRPPHFTDARMQRAQFESDLLRAEEALLEMLTSPAAPDTS